MKKILVIMVICILILTGCGKNEKTRNTNNDASLFKKEYEKLNGKKIKDHEIRKVTISKKNPIIYKSADEIVEMIDNKETFIVYFGFAECPWCRSMIENMLSVSKDLNIKTIYYVDVENIRDKKELNPDSLIEEKEGIITVEEGSAGYMDLLNRLDKVLEKYILTDDDGNEFDTDEKRIFAPNVITIVDGKAVSLTTGIPDELDDPYMKLTDKINDKSKKMLKKTMSEINSNVCTKESC